jgi:succinate dehydrogenase/fumarate reductase flavoprotein subunit
MVTEEELKKVKGGGFSQGMVIPPDHSIDNFVQWITENGGYISNQDWTYAFGGDSYKTTMEVVGWGPPFHKEKDVVKVFPTMKHYATVVFYPKHEDEFRKKLNQEFMQKEKNLEVNYREKLELIKQAYAKD